MAQINNSELTKEIIDVARLHPGADRVPSRLADAVVPVIDINPKHARICDIVRGASQTGNSATLYTTPSDRDFYLTAASLSFVCDSAANATGNAFIVATINGANQFILIHSILTLTAQNQVTSLSFPVPVKIDRGTVISYGHTTTTLGNVVTAANIIGYTVLTE